MNKISFFFFFTRIALNTLANDHGKLAVVL